MEKFICLECGNIFDEPEYWEEYRGECFGTPAYETMHGCPDCGGAYVETYRCEACGAWIDTDTYVEIGDEKYCENCFTIRKLENI